MDQARVGGAMFRFGQVEFDEVRGRLRVAGRAIELDRPCLSILAVLVRDAGKDIGKDRLLEAGWPGRIVHENSLAKAVSRLRRALGEDGEALETIHGHGYRLAAEVRAVPAGDAKSAAPPRKRRFPRPALLLTAVVTLAGLTAAAMEAFSSNDRFHELWNELNGEPPDSIGRILWVDDHPENIEVERRYLEERNVMVYQVGTTAEALALLAMYDYEAVISDMGRTEGPLAGIRLVQEMRTRGDATPFVVYTIVPSEAQRSLVAESGGQAVAVTSDELYDAVLPLMED
jgi:DNA-binding response OmpR family regulator